MNRAMPNNDLLSKMMDLCRADIPGFRLAYKDGSPFMRFLGRILFFAPGFMTDYTTTIGTTVYFPSYASVQADRDSAAETLAHEYVHLWDHKRLGIRFQLSYLYPQIFAAGSLLAFLAFLWPGFLATLAALVFLCPIPSEPRTRHEMRGYAMTIAIEHWRRGHVGSGFLDWIQGFFTGWSYYRMEPDAEIVHTRLDEIVEGLEDGSFLQQPNAEPYQRVYQLIQDCQQVENDLPSRS
jgi:UPF0716 family protein affecting phage T7 exclusion